MEAIAAADLALTAVEAALAGVRAHVWGLPRRACQVVCVTAPTLS